MSKKQEDLRNRVVQMFENWKLHPKSMIVSHFVAEGYKRNTMGLLEDMRKQEHRLDNMVKEENL